jgi:hypothetical protein
MKAPKAATKETLRRSSSTWVLLRRVAERPFLAPDVDDHTQGNPVVTTTGFFPTRARALRALRADAESARSRDTLLRYTLSEVPFGLHVPCRSSTHYDDRGRILCATTFEGHEQRWAGRPRRQCRYAIGDIVGVLGERVTIGVVLARPPSPTDALARSGRLDVSDDVYLVGFPDGDGDAHRLDHDHPHESDLVRVTTPLADTLLSRLRRRLRDYARGDKEAASVLLRGRVTLAARFGSATSSTRNEDVTSRHTEER